MEMALRTEESEKPGLDDRDSSASSPCRRAKSRRSNSNGEATTGLESDENEIDHGYDIRSEDDRGQKLDADKLLRASQLLTAAANRDLTDEELKVLSIVQLAEYAKIRHDRRKGDR